MAKTPAQFIDNLTTCLAPRSTLVGDYDKRDILVRHHAHAAEVEVVAASMCQDQPLGILLLAEAPPTAETVGLAG